MSELREPLADPFFKVCGGEVPLDTARELHLIAHRHNMDRYVTIKENKNLGYERAKELLKLVK